MKNFNQLNKDIVSAVKLFAEFGQRNHYERKGRVIIQNDVTDPEGEGVFLARCARKIAKREGNAYAYEWALQQFTEGAYNRLQTRNKTRETVISAKLKDYKLRRFLRDISYQF